MPFSQTVTIAENEQKSVAVALTPEPQEVRPSAGGGAGDVAENSNPRLIPYVIGGVGIASLISSGVLFGMRQKTLSDLEDQCGSDHVCPSSAAGDYSNLKTYNVTAQVALGVGVACVGTAVTMLVLQRKHAAPKSGMTLLPSAPNSLAGVSWAGRF